MRILIILTGLVALCACSTHSYNLETLMIEQSDSIEAACGHRPVSKLKGARSPREVIYSACRSETIKSMRTPEDLAEAS